MTGRIRFTVLAALAVFAAAVSAAPAKAAPATNFADPYCEITTATTQWNGGYQTNVTIKNVGNVIVTWRATLTPRSGTVVSNIWSAAGTYANGKYTVVPLPYGRYIPPGYSFGWGFDGTGQPPSVDVVCTPA